MAKTKISEFIISNPLNSILCSEINLRILRYIIKKVEVSIAIPTLVKDTGLTFPTVKKSLEQLLKTGILLRVGKEYALNNDYMLIQAIIDLFEAENRFYNSFIEDIKEIISNLMHKPECIWVIEDSEYNQGDPFPLYVFDKAAEIDLYASNLQSETSKLVKKYEVVIDVIPYTKADLKSIDNIDIIKSRILYGFHPYFFKKNPLRNKDKDLFIKIADLIHKNPDLVKRAKNYVHNLLNQDFGTANSAIREWDEIINNYSINALCNFSTSGTDRAERLNQSSPFLAILSPEEKKQLSSGNDK